MYQTRIQNVLRALDKLGMQQMLISNPKAIWYLTGISVAPMERFFALYLTASGKHVLFLNKLFNVPSSELCEVWLSDTDNVVQALLNVIDPTLVLGVDKDLPAKHLLPLQESAPALVCKLGSQAIDLVRSVKDASEQQAMREASRINDLCIEQAAAYVKCGMSELQVVEYLKACYAEHGASGVSFEPIVAFGANASDPHHESDHTTAKDGDCVLIDTGCVYHDYCSDMTRTYFLHTADPKQVEIYNIVREANELAIASIQPGMMFCEIDKIARDHITNAGYGDFFMHRLGHSIGADCHEFGDVGALNTDTVQVGNVFSIEPGIYLKEQFGVRIEDLVIVTANGCENLNAASKQVQLIG